MGWLSAIGKVASGILGGGGGGGDGGGFGLGDIAYGLGGLLGGSISSNQARKQSAEADKVNMERQAKLSFQNYEKQWDHKIGQGLTPWELTGTSTSNAPTPSNTLGNNPALRNQSLQRQQQGFMARENQKERDNKLKLAAITTRAPLEQSGIALKNYQLQAEQQPHKIQQIKAQIEQTKALSAKTRFEFKNAWELKMATMSAENVITALTMFSHGLDLEAVLKATGDSSPEHRADVAKALKELRLYQSHVGRETLGANEIIKVGVSTGTKMLKKGLNILGGAKRKRDSQRSEKFNKHGLPKPQHDTTRAN